MLAPRVIVNLAASRIWPPPYFQNRSVGLDYTDLRLRKWRSIHVFRVSSPQCYPCIYRSQIRDYSQFHSYDRKHLLVQMKPIKNTSSIQKLLHIPLYALHHLYSLERKTWKIAVEGTSSSAHSRVSFHGGAIYRISHQSQ